MKAVALNLGITVGKNPFIAGLKYDLNALSIHFQTDAGDIEVDIVFQAPHGFRCLDELDLHTYWQDSYLREHWFLEILEGGWMDLESTRDGFVSKEIGFREFLICGSDDCVSVIANSPPTVAQPQTD